IDRQTSTGPEFKYFWENQSDGQVYRVVITMRNAQGCTEQTERFIMDDPINCASSTMTHTGASQGAGTEALPWLMNAGDEVTVNPPAGSPIESVRYSLFQHPGNNAVGTPILQSVQTPPVPFEFVWTDTGKTFNQKYRLQLEITYLDGCAETVERYITHEPPPVCVGATATASGAAGGTGLTAAAPWLLNGGDTITIAPATNGIINQVVFTTTAVTANAATVPVTTDSTSPFVLTWTDQATDNAIYRIDAVITYAPGCTETVTRYVQDQVCSGAVVTQSGSTGAGTGLTTVSPWVFDNGDVVTVAPPVGSTFTDVSFRLFNEPGTSAIAGASDATAPYTFAWTNRVDDALYRLEITITYTPGCVETLTRYIRDQGICFITASVGAITNVQNNGNQDDFATITYTISNPSNEPLTLRGIKVDWLRDPDHPVAILDQITFTGAASTTLTVAAGAGAPPTTGVLSVTGAPVIPANSSNYRIAIRYNLRARASALTDDWINKLCIQYTAPSFISTTASCNVRGSISGNPGACN
ncbi:MAG TPA: hypothetical protein VE010_14070, partial [Thermoanaerobaculia bacterium]|nr:hypothetical protein [Thermoanaerobaculia bacterium]